MSRVPENFNLLGKKALVTGGATGIGFHITRALARAGATVLMAARREDVLRAAAQGFNEDPNLPGEVRWFPVDLASRDSVQALAAHALDDFGGVDIYIGNAAQSVNEHIEQMKDSSIDALLRVNVAANAELVRAFLPGMRARKWGRVIFSSTAATVVTSPHEGIAMYTSCKAALNAFMRTVAAEAGHDRVTANCLNLGFFVTDMVVAAQDAIRAGQGEEGVRAFMENFAGNTALGRAGRPEEVEGLILLLASDAGSFITGASLAIDGGMSIMLRSNGMVD